MQRLHHGQLLDVIVDPEVMYPRENLIDSTIRNRQLVVAKVRVVECAQSGWRNRRFTTTMSEGWCLHSCRMLFARTCLCVGRHIAVGCRSLRVHVSMRRAAHSCTEGPGQP
jgi:hypothetical protein